MNAEQAWQSVLAQLQMEMPRASFDTWVRDTRPMAYENGILPLVCAMRMRVTGWKAALRPLSAVC